jgi:predicted nucleic acid-binding Zn ribbon protein
MKGNFCARVTYKQQMHPCSNQSSIFFAKENPRLKKKTIAFFCFIALLIFSEAIGIQQGKRYKERVVNSSNQHHLIYSQASSSKETHSQKNKP